MGAKGDHANLVGMIGRGKPGREQDATEVAA